MTSEALVRPVAGPPGTAVHRLHRRGFGHPRTATVDTVVKRALDALDALEGRGHRQAGHDAPLECRLAPITAVLAPNKHEKSTQEPPKVTLDSCTYCILRTWLAGAGKDGREKRYGGRCIRARFCAKRSSVGFAARWGGGSRLPSRSVRYHLPEWQVWLSDPKIIWPGVTAGTLLLYFFWPISVKSWLRNESMISLGQTSDNSS